MRPFLFSLRCSRWSTLCFVVAWACAGYGSGWLDPNEVQGACGDWLASHAGRSHAGRSQTGGSHAGMMRGDARHRRSAPQDAAALKLVGDHGFPGTGVARKELSPEVDKAVPLPCQGPNCRQADWPTPLLPVTTGVHLERRDAEVRSLPVDVATSLGFRMREIAGDEPRDGYPAGIFRPPSVLHSASL